MKVTIQDIANMVGVSKSTVSRYLNGGYVSGENVNKIKEAIEKTGFETNFFAKRLKAKKSKLIGIIIPRIDSFTAGKTLNGINKKLEEHGYQGIILTSELNREKELSHIKKLYQQGVDGIIIMSFEIAKEHVKIANQLPIPVMFSGQRSEYLNYITLDDEKIGRLLGEYIKKQGHRNIVFLGVSEKDKSVGILRKKGFYEGFEGEEYKLNFVETDFSFNKAYESGEKVLEYNPTAVVCATDNIALGLMRFLLERGIKIPKDISIAGFGGYDVGAITYPSLTTVKIDYKLFGEKTADRILNLIDEEKLDEIDDVPLELIVRESVKRID
ncbi:LacI family DNA-binding transcriptional regulator [Clostridium sardiniense]|uniref:LacI family DNA-binding transcriptional regulator n=1 Tax=Clostridium sardiniense TaxID=29369 RepID=UPI00195E2717|nr:LacI family DNA-binding transcriptional regulator [Clostridium sardiniense]MBM7835229.1 LacI family sucrose operon transcriptional repressor [Clostridium sardiniense]